MKQKIKNFILDIDSLIEEQEKGITDNNSNFSWLNGRANPTLITYKLFFQELLSLDWDNYNIDAKESFIETVGGKLGECGFLRICIKHSDKNLKMYSYNGRKEDIFIELVLAEEVTITYPSGHTHSDYYDLLTGKYIKNNDTTQLLKDILENNMKIKYIFHENQLYDSGIWKEKSQRFWMSHPIIFRNFWFWIKKICGMATEEREEILEINWKKQD